LPATEHVENVVAGAFARHQTDHFNPAFSIGAPAGAPAGVPLQRRRSAKHAHCSAAELQPV